MKYCIYTVIFLVCFIISSPISICSGNISSNRDYSSGYHTCSSPAQPVKKEFFRAGPYGTWIKSWEQRFEFDKPGNDSLMTWLVMDEGQLANSRRQTKFFNEQSQVTKDLVQTWENNRWTNKNKYEYTYDDKGYCTYNVYSLWSPDSLVWRLDSRCQSIYNGYGKITRTFNQEWSCMDDSIWYWRNVKKHEFNYNANGSLIRSRQYGWVGEWACIEYHDYNYDDTLLVEENLSTVNGTQIELSRSINYHNYFRSGSLYKTEIVWSKWQDSVQTLIEQDAFYYNNGSLSKRVHSDWNNNSWVDDRQIFFFYNSHGDLSMDSTVEMIFDKWTNTTKTTYTYPYETAIDDNPKFNTLDIRISPTPAHENMSVALPGYSGSYQAKLFSSAGELVFESLSKDNNMNINVISYPPGVYYLLIINEHGSAVRPVVIL